MIKTKNPIPKNWNILIYLFFNAFFLLLFWKIVNTLESGYHLVDDHEVLLIDNQIYNEGFSSALKYWLQKDLSIRLRPIYFFFRVTFSFIFGGNFVLWAVYKSLLLGSTSYFLFRFLTYLFTPILALGGTFLVVFGEQFEVWYRLAPAEALGMFFLSIALYNLTCKRIWISTIFMLIASLTKESFLIFIPAFLLIFLFIKYKEDILNGKLHLLKMIRENYAYLIVMILYVLLCITYILKNIGSNSIGYAGIEEKDIVDRMRDLLYLFRTNIYTIVSALSLLVYVVLHFNKPSKIWLEYVVIYIICACIVIPQYLLYEKSRLSGRYFVPMVIGYVLVIVYPVNKFIFSFKGQKVTRYILFFILTLPVSYLLITNAIISYEWSRSYASSGYSTKKIFEMVDLNSEEKILYVLEPGYSYESAYAFESYIKYAMGMDSMKLNFFPIVQDYEHIPWRKDYLLSVRDKFQKQFGHLSADYLNLRSKDYQLVVIVPFWQKDIESEFLSKVDMNGNFERKNVAPYVVYIKK